MVRRVKAVGGKVAGMIWYQGESDANEPAQPAYRKKMIDFMKAVRKDLAAPSMFQDGLIHGHIPCATRGRGGYKSPGYHRTILLINLRKLLLVSKKILVYIVIVNKIN